MFGRYQPREMKVRKKSKSNKGNTQNYEMPWVHWFQPWLHDKPQKAERILQQACLSSGSSTERMQEELPLRLLWNKLRERNVLVQCPCIFHFLLIKIYFLNTRVASPAHLWLRNWDLCHAFKDFIQDQEERVFGPVWVVHQSLMEKLKSSVFEEA